MPELSSEQLLAMQQEIAALIRAGVPLDQGLRSLAADLPGKVGKATRLLAARLEGGESLDAVFNALGAQERVYGAVLTAGMRSGNPATALEGTVQTAQRFQRLRSSFRAELIYPAMLFVIGLGLLNFSLKSTVPIYEEQAIAFDAAKTFTHRVTTLLTGLATYGHWVALTLLLALAAIWIASSRRSATDLGPRRSWSLFRTIRQWDAIARFCDLLALMIENAVPLPEALPLAGTGSGWDLLAQQAEQLAAGLHKGERSQHAWPLPSIATLLANSSTGHPGNAADYVRLLRREADHARRRADRRSRWIVTWIPLAITLVVGVTLVVLMAIVNLGPLLNFMVRLVRADNA